MTTTFTPPRPPAKTAIYELMKLVVPCWSALCYPVVVRGRNHLPDAGAAVILPKHQYWTDIPLIGLAFKGVQLHYMAKQELFRFSLIRRFLIALGGIPLDRQVPIKSMGSFRYLDYLLKSGQRVVIFPEGTYYRGVMGKGKSRLIEMILKVQQRDAHQAMIPFIPVGVIYGKERVRRRVTITIGAPLYHDEKQGNAVVFTRSIMEAIAHLSEMETAR